MHIFKTVMFALVAYCVPMLAAAQCDPSTINLQGGGRIQNPDGTWTVTQHASFGNDGNPWAHTYPICFPQTVTYGSTILQFVGSAVAYVQGYHCSTGYRAVTVVSITGWSLKDSSGNLYNAVKSEVQNAHNCTPPEDRVTSTSTLLSGQTYDFAVSGSESGTNERPDTLVISAIYQ